MFLDKRIVTKKDLVQVLKELNIKKQEAAATSSHIALGESRSKSFAK